MLHKGLYIGKARRSYRFKPIVELLIHEVNKVTNNDGLFGTIKDLMTIAALIAYEKGLDPVPIDSVKGEKPHEIVAKNEWENDWKNLSKIFALAVAVEGDTDVVRQENEGRVIDIFEGYSTAGLLYLEEKLNKSSDPYGDKAILDILDDIGVFNLEEESVA